MKEVFEFWVRPSVYRLLPKGTRARFNGSVYILRVSSGDPLFEALGELDRQARQRDKSGFLYWRVIRKYDKQELNEAALFAFQYSFRFEPVGEECGTVYDETEACKECGVGRKLVGLLKLRRSSIPKTDIAKTIAGEVVVSERLVKAFTEHDLKGVSFDPVCFSTAGDRVWYHPHVLQTLELSDKIIAGDSPFDLSNETIEAQEAEIGGFTFQMERMVKRCPKGHTVGLGLISEVLVRPSPAIMRYDLFQSRQMIGAKQGYLQPEPVWLCSPAFRAMVIEENLKGFSFEIARVVE
jgi:hypothetical protein